MPFVAFAQNVENTYRLNNSFAVAAPACENDLETASAAGTCSSATTPGNFVEDNLVACGASFQRTVWHTNLHYGLKFNNTGGSISDTYTIQMYVKNTAWNANRVRIVDFSDGQTDEGIYLKSTAGFNDRCIDFYPDGIVGPCPSVALNKYYLLTITRNGTTNTLDIYLDNVLVVSYNDTGKRYTGKAGTPVYIYRDDQSVSCESGEANFAYVSFKNYYASQAMVTSVFNGICSEANINSWVDFAIDPNPSCGRKDIKITYTGGLPQTAIYTFEWNFDGATVLSGSGRGPYTIRWNTPGNKNVNLTITNESCNKKISNTKPTTVSFVNFKFDIDDSKCDGTATMEVRPQNGVTPYKYSIDAVNYQDSNIFQVKADTYNVFVRDYNGCISDTTITVELTGSIQLEPLADTTICAGESIKLTTTGNVSNYVWSPAATLDNELLQEPIASPQQTTTYKVTASDGSCSRSAEVTISVIPEVQVVTAPDASVPYGQSYQMSASSPQLDGYVVSYVWTPPAGLSATNIANPVAVVTADQLYEVTLSSNQGCVGTGTVLLTVVPPTLLMLPDAFTPDGDGKNEVLLPITNGIASINFLKIYNRWGEVIYFSKELTAGWDGKIRGINAAPGAYPWYMEGITSDGEIIKKRGTVLLIR